jgi:lysozyme
MPDNLIAKAFNQLPGQPLAASEEQTPTAGQECFCQNTVPSVPSYPAASHRPVAVSAVGISLIKQFEGCARRRADGRYEAYPDPGTGNDPWTIGWGATGPDGFAGGKGARIQRGTIWTGAQCDARLEADLVRYAGQVARAIGDAPTSQAQFDALVSFHYNTGAIARASLTRKHKAGDCTGAAAEFARWVRAGGRVLPGLERRRQAEAELYSSLVK